jgi:hypothetical protein
MAQVISMKILVKPDVHQEHELLQIRALLI